jgi:ABC-type maltose transport system permease subunit
MGIQYNFAACSPVLPVAILLDGLYFQKHFTQGITIGAMKG